MGIGLAAAGWLNPAWAAAAMVVSSSLVVTNSLRLAGQLATPDHDGAQDAAACSTVPADEIESAVVLGETQPLAVEAQLS